MGEAKTEVTDAPRSYTGVTQEAPETTAGATFELLTFTRPPPAEDGFWSHDLHLGEGAFMALGAQIAGGMVQIHGSATLVAPGVAATARHVFDDIVMAEGFTGALGLAPRPDGGITYWNVTSYNPIAKFDVVLMAVRPMTGWEHLRRIWRPAIHARVPELGERVSVIGYRDLGQSHSDGALSLGLFESVGRVTTVHNTGRDRVMLPNPCCEVDVAILGGMSGGPAFDEAGNLIGVASTSVSGDGDRPGFISLIWPALVWPVDPVWPQNMHADRTTLKAMSASELRLADIIDADLVIRTETDGDQQQFELRPREIGP